MIVRTGLRAVDPLAQQAIGAGYSIGTAAATPALASSAVAAGILPAALAAPIVGAAFAGIFIGIEALLNSGCGQSCVVTSNWANQAEGWLKQNLAAYMALPTPRAESAQAAYLANFDKIWGYLEQECGSPEALAQLGTAAKNCIADRQQGACHYQANGQCWNWFVGYRDPIANDPNVVPDSAAAGAGSTNLLQAISGSTAGGGISPLLLIGGILLLVGVGAMATS